MDSYSSEPSAKKHKKHKKDKDKDKDRSSDKYEGEGATLIGFQYSEIFRF
jgi:hypothetical protein